MVLKWLLWLQVLLVACTKGAHGYGGIPAWLRSKQSPLETRQLQQWLGDPAVNKAASTDVCKEAGLFWCEAWHDGGSLGNLHEQALILPPCDTCNGSGRVVPSELELFFLPSALQEHGNTPLEVPNLINSVPPSKFLPDPLAKDLLLPILNDNVVEDHAFEKLLYRLGISPTSTMAHAMYSSLRVCTAANQDNQLNTNTISFCAPSLESMLHFSLSSTNTSLFSFQVLSSDPISPSYKHKNNQDAVVSSNMNQDVLKILNVRHGYNLSVVCHKLVFPFELHWCHQLPNTTIYEVDLQLSTSKQEVAMNYVKRSLMSAIAACHLDTTTWPPYHPALKKLHLHPGKSSPVCHWIPNDTPVWV